MWFLTKEGNDIFINHKKIINKVKFYSGKTYNECYQEVKQLNNSTFCGTINGRTFRIVDLWEVDSTTNKIRLERELYIGRNANKSDGIQIKTYIPLMPGRWEFFIPAACYREYPLEKTGEEVNIMEERLPYPLILAYCPERKISQTLFRINTAEVSYQPQRFCGDMAYLHDTDLGSIGYYHKGTESKLIISLPYEEGPLSRALNSQLNPIIAFLPMNRERNMRVIYELKGFYDLDFNQACLEAYRYAYELNKPEPVKLPFSLKESVIYRAEALERLVQQRNGYWFFHLNFNPREGKEKAPTGFGRDFNTIQSNIFPRVVEYGFTGRQLNSAYVLMKLGRDMGRKQWYEKGEAVVKSFFEHCIKKKGFTYTLFDIEENKPFSPFGNELGSKLHYGVLNAPEGNYLRNMVEAANDLLLAYEIAQKKEWFEAVLDFSNFLTVIQDKDGAWYRAYTTEGKPITEPRSWFGQMSLQQKAMSALPIAFLVKLYQITKDETFLNSAQRAGDWVLENIVANDFYKGGTLDNANVIDKEAMGLTLSGLLALFEGTGQERYLEGAKRAGGLALTWNYLWDVPFEPGTRLAECNFKTRGWGGIDIIWAGSVVDIYSLSFCRDWYCLSQLTGDDLFEKIALLIMHGTQQMLSYPENLYGLIEPGMQEEGFAVSSLGRDEGLITKGDTWGSLGWVYAIGTYGILRVLEELDTK